MIDEIKQALEKAESGGYHIGNVADEWLLYLIGEVEAWKERFDRSHIRHTETLVQVEQLQKALKQWEDFANHLNNITSCSMTKNEIRQALNTFARKAGDTQ